MKTKVLTKQKLFSFFGLKCDQMNLMKLVLWFIINQKLHDATKITLPKTMLSFVLANFVNIELSLLSNSGIYFIYTDEDSTQISLDKKSGRQLEENVEVEDEEDEDEDGDNEEEEEVASDEEEEEVASDEEDGNKDEEEVNTETQLKGKVE